MSARERIKRPVLERTEPIRSWVAHASGGADRTVRSGAPSPGGPGTAPSTGVGDAISRAVDLGYRVIDDYIAQGQRAASMLGQGSWSGTPSPADASDLIGAMSRSMTEAVGLWAEILSQATPRAAAGAATAAGAAAPQAASHNGSASASTDQAPAVAAYASALRLEVDSSRPVQVIVDLSPNCDLTAARVEPLHATTSPATPLNDVSLSGPSAGGPRSLRVRVPSTQPAGTYHGVVVDSRTETVVGTVSARVASSPTADSREARKPKAKSSVAAKTPPRTKGGTRSKARRKR